MLYSSEVSYVNGEIFDYYVGVKTGDITRRKYEASWVRIPIVEESYLWWR